MQLEDQVCDLQQGKRLSELGISNDSFFHWFMDDDVINGEHWKCGRLAYSYDAIPAFTVAELGVMLPSGFDTMYVGTEKGWRGYDNDSQDYPYFNCLFKTEAQARAAMLIRLLEMKTITPEEVNQRLTI